MFLGVAIEALFSPDDYVFVAREDGRLQVWDSVFSYEKSTGRKWNSDPLQDFELVATFHNADRRHALKILSGLGLLIGGLVFVLRKLKVPADRGVHSRPAGTNSGAAKDT